MGYKMLSCSVFVLLAAIPGMRHFLRTLRETGEVATAGAAVASMNDYYDILKLKEWQDYEAAYTPPSE
jgi:2-methylisocitrate lyase-like PEP mutase family enzyme